MERIGESSEHKVKKQTESLQQEVQQQRDVGSPAMDGLTGMKTPAITNKKIGHLDSLKCLLTASQPNRNAGISEQPMSSNTRSTDWNQTEKLKSSNVKIPTFDTEVSWELYNSQFGAAAKFRLLIWL